MIKKLLVANRGEIACRVIRAARGMGVATVAVYSDADADAMHAKLADEAVRIGSPEPSESYLKTDALLDAARETGCDAVHPGYGFLSESAAFAEACRKAKLTFVGPSAAAMRKLGAKIDAKKLAGECGVPVTPGFFELGAADKDLKKAAKKIGYPVMLKASAGGGGRGMRAVRQEQEFDRELKLASEEAVKAFGDGTMMVEKLIERPRHIEVQVLADHHGSVACLFERECSLQRRHQKVIEESPSPFMTNALWADMCDATTKLVKAAGYTNAGTVEFMVDTSSGAFYFLEVNARLQVEHPVTEVVTGVDLVQWQLRIASGEELSLSPFLMAGDRSAIRGHAIEARVISEDPARGFLPSVGRIVGWAEPLDPSVRVDTGFGPGAEVTRFYDSLLAKVITGGENRAAAVSRLRAALMDFHILGVTTNIGYVLDVLAHPAFASGEVDTGFLGREFGEWSGDGEVPEEMGALVAVAFGGNGHDREVKASSPAWDAADGFRVTS